MLEFFHTLFASAAILWGTLIHDDLLATGGTAYAAAELIKRQGGLIAGFNFLIDLSFLKGSEILKAHSDNIYSIIQY